MNSLEFLKKLMGFKEFFGVFKGYILVFLLIFYSNNFLTEIIIILRGCLKIIYNPNEFVRIFENN